MIAACGPEDGPPPTDSVDDTPADPTITETTWLRRMTYSEYTDTITALLGTPVMLENELPRDYPVWGFDRTREALHLSPLLVESYDKAATKVVEAILDRSLMNSQRVLLAPSSGEGSVTAQGTGGVVRGEGKLNFVVDVAIGGRYALEVLAWSATGDVAFDTPTVGLRLDDALIGAPLAAAARSEAEATPLPFDLPLPAGQHYIGVEVTAPTDFVVGTVTLVGPTDVTDFPGNPAWDAVMLCDPATAAAPRECAAQILAAFAPKAWRRPMADVDEAELLALFDAGVAAGADPREATGYALQSVLLRPEFLFHRDRMVSVDGGPATLDAWSTAARLSYLVTSAPPDEALRAAAAADELATPEQRVAQLQRLWGTSAALSRDFLHAWLAPGVLTKATRRNETPIRLSGEESLQLLFDDALLPDQPLPDLLLSDLSPVDPLLAELYGIPAPPDGLMTWTDLSSVGRRGLLTHPAVLWRLNVPTRHSIVKRGNFVLSAVLCSEAPPPPNVPPLGTTVDAPTQREQLEQHRADPACASCHDRIDPIGVGFERFDAEGRWREDDNGYPVDAQGYLPDGTTFDGAVEMATALGSGPDFNLCAVEKMFIYAQGVKPAGDVAEQAIAEMSAVADDPSASLYDLFEALVRSDAFVAAPGGEP
jgi:hypothetical protein